MVFCSAAFLSWASAGSSQRFGTVRVARFGAGVHIRDAARQAVPRGKNNPVDERRAPNPTVVSSDILAFVARRTRPLGSSSRCPRRPPSQRAAFQWIPWSLWKAGGAAGAAGGVYAAAVGAMAGVGGGRLQFFSAAVRRNAFSSPIVLL